MPKHAAHATLERERTRSRIVDDEPAPPAALEECLGVLPLGDDDFEMLDIVGVSSADELGLTDADLIVIGRTAAMQAAQELAAAKEAAKEAARQEEAAAKAAVCTIYRYHSGIDHSLIDLESGVVNWYLRIPLSSLILLSSSGAVFSRDPLHRTAPMLWKT